MQGNRSHNQGTSQNLPGATQLEISGLELSKTPVKNQQSRKGRYRTFTRPPTSPDLFASGKTEQMASNRLIWEGSNILTQGQNLNWADSEQGSLYYKSPVEKGKGYVTFWLTNDLHTPNPTLLEGEVALALIEEFDIRAACLHLIYAAHATQLERPWEQSFVLSNTQLERYLGLDKNHKLNKQQKLTLMLELAKQPCHLLVYISWPEKGAVGSFSVSRTWLWEIAEPILHFQNCLRDDQGQPIGEETLVGFTLNIRCGHWAQYFLNSEKRLHKSGYYEYGLLSQGFLHDLMSLWHHHEGGVRLMTWLLFKLRVNHNSSLTVELLMKIAFGTSLVEQAKGTAKDRKKLVRRWETVLKILRKKEWGLIPDPETYPPQYWPFLQEENPLSQIPNDPEAAASFWAKDALFGKGTHLSDITKRSRNSFEQLLNARLLVHLPPEIAEKLEQIERRSQPIRKKALKKSTTKPAPAKKTSTLTGKQVREFRTAKGWSTRKLAASAGISQSMVVLIEKGVDRGGQPISPAFEVKLKKVFGLT